MDRLRKHLTYANVMSTLAAFVAVAGSTAYAADHLGRDSVGAAQLKPDSVTGAKVRDHSLRGSDINVPSLPTVPSATEAKHADSAGQADHAGIADHAGTADHAVNADHATSAGTAEHATNADHAVTAQTAALADSVAAPEALHFVGKPGEPILSPDFVAASQPPPSFYLDRDGIVHLEGEVRSTAANSTILFALPPAYAPEAERQLVFGGVHVSASADLLVSGEGQIIIPGVKAEGELISLDGITWRARG